MFSKIRTSHHHTIYASYLGYITQAIVNNIAPLLFIQLQTEFSLTLAQITLFTTVNFLVQLCVDLASTLFVDRLGYRPCILAAHLFSAAGFLCMAFLPGLLPNPYIGLMAAVILYAIGGGLIEVLISPIVEACPTEGKAGAMSLLHSFYCWGQMGFVALSTLFFVLAGTASWRLLCCLWTLIPLGNTLYFSLVPIYPIIPDGQKPMPLRTLLYQKTFWILMLMMLCSGASELGMSQWASAFAESALHVSKTVGDLAGPCAFALTMGVARAIYGKHSERLPLLPSIIASSVLCIVCYMVAAFIQLPVFGLIGCAVCGFSVGIFWPGTFSVASATLPAGGTAMFALLALAGDMGCTSGPTLVGMIASSSSLHTGLSFAILFPVLMIVGVLLLKRETRK